MPNSAGPFASDFTEAELIERISGQLPPAADWVVVGIGDDAAVVEPARNRQEVLSTDSLVEGVHFDRRFTPAEAIGHRALAVNLSDLAAMGAEPRLALLSLAVPSGLPVTEFDGIITGLIALAARHRVSLVGGNITRTPGPLVVDVTVAGSVKRRQMLTRSGARPGDELYVTGWIGSAAAGLGMLKAGFEGQAGRSCVDRYLFPEPRIRMGLLVGRNRAATACIDLSDGLAEGVRHLAERSGVGAVLCAGAIPVEDAARRWFEQDGGDATEQAVAGGDDYELLIAIRPRLKSRLTAALERGDVSITRIGACTSERHVMLDCSGTMRHLPRGYAHFR